MMAVALLLPFAASLFVEEPQSCPARCTSISGCGSKWCALGSKVQQCCMGVTVHGSCAYGCTNGTVGCQCEGSHIDATGTCAARIGSKCPTPSPDTTERKQYNADLARISDSFKIAVGVHTGTGVSFPQFFDQFFMKGWEKVFENDQNQLIAFQALMSIDNPPQPDETQLGEYFYGIFKHLLLHLPGGKEIGFVLELAKGGIAATTTTDNTHRYTEGISWKQFLQASALKLSSVHDQFTNGIYNYTKGQWTRNVGDVEEVLKSEDQAGYKEMQALLTAQWQNMHTPTQAFRNYLANYMNSVGAGIAVYCYANEYKWTVSQIPGSVAFGDALMKSTGNCLHPPDNLMDEQGNPVQMAFITKYVDSGPHHAVRNARWDGGGVVARGVDARA